MRKPAFFVSGPLAAPVATPSAVVPAGKTPSPCQSRPYCRLSAVWLPSSDLWQLERKRSSGPSLVIQRGDLAGRRRRQRHRGTMQGAGDNSILFNKTLVMILAFDTAVFVFSYCDSVVLCLFVPFFLSLRLTYASLVWLLLQFN